MRYISFYSYVSEEVYYMYRYITRCCFSRLVSVFMIVKVKYWRRNGRDRRVELCRIGKTPSLVMRHSFGIFKEQDIRFSVKKL